jgi:ATP-binding protein involved in chromosome partitioning
MSTKIAIPVEAGRLSPHFGHCREFALYEVDPKVGRVLSHTTEAAPPHDPGVLPRWLHALGTAVVIAGGMGQRAQQLFEQAGIQVVVGAPAEDAAKIVASYLDGSLSVGTNLCDH